MQFQHAHVLPIYLGHQPRHCPHYPRYPLPAKQDVASRALLYYPLAMVPSPLVVLSPRHFHQNRLKIQVQQIRLLLDHLWTILCERAAGFGLELAGDGVLPCPTTRDIDVQLSCFWSKAGHTIEVPPQLLLRDWLPFFLTPVSAY